MLWWLCVLHLSAVVLAQSLICRAVRALKMHLMSRVIESLFSTRHSLAGLSNNTYISCDERWTQSFTEFMYAPLIWLSQDAAAATRKFDSELFQLVFPQPDNILTNLPISIALNPAKSWIRGPCCFQHSAFSIIYLESRNYGRQKTSQILLDIFREPKRRERKGRRYKTESTTTITRLAPYRGRWIYQQ